VAAPVPSPPKREAEAAEKAPVNALRAALSEEEDAKYRHLEAMVELHLAEFEAEIARGAR
jgi:hypothetical protein